MSNVEKVDMSLDDIIKLNKAIAKKGRGRGLRGRGQKGNRVGRGQRNGNVTSGGNRQTLGRGRGIARSTSRGNLRGGRGSVRGNKGVGGGSIRGNTGGGGGSLRGSLRGSRGSLRGSIGRGRGSLRANSGGGRGSQRGNTSGGRGSLSANSRGRRGKVQGNLRGGATRGNILSRIGTKKDAVNKSRAARGRGASARGTRRQRNQMIFTNSSFKTQAAKQRLLKAKQNISLAREKEVAIKNLQRAKENIQTINSALQKTARDNLINQRRGLNVQSTARGGASRGRGRRLLAGLARQTVSTRDGLTVTSPNELSRASTETRLLNHTSVTISNPSAANNRGRRRRWRRGNKRAESFENLQIGLQNSVPQQSIQEQLKQLKPSVPTTYQFQKNVFSVPTTSKSLNDRFSHISGNGAEIEDRKVFV